MTHGYEIGENLSTGPPFTSPLAKLAIVYLIIKMISSIGAQRYFSPLKKSQILHHFYNTMLSTGMLYTKHKQLYLSMRMAVILHILGSKRNSLPSLTTHLAAIHHKWAAQHSMWALVFPRTSSKCWEDGPPKPGNYTFMITLPYIPNYSLQLYTSTSVVYDCFAVMTTRFHLFTPPPSPTPNIISLS